MPAGLEDVHGQPVVKRDAYEHGHRVQVGPAEHLPVVVKGHPRAELCGQLRGGLLMRGAYRRQLDAGHLCEGRQVGSRGPSVSHVGADQPHPNLSVQLAWLSCHRDPFIIGFVQSVRNRSAVRPYRVLPVPGRGYLFYGIKATVGRI